MSNPFIPQIFREAATKPSGAKRRRHPIQHPSGLNWRQQTITLGVTFAMTAFAAVSISPFHAARPHQEAFGNTSASPPISLVATTTQDEQPSDAIPPRVPIVERLDRGLVAIVQSNEKVFLSWRMLGLDPTEIRFHLFRISGDQEIQLNDSPLQNTWFIDDSWDSSVETTYRVIADPKTADDKCDNTFTLPAKTSPAKTSPAKTSPAETLPANAEARKCLEIPLQQPEPGTTPDGKEYQYTANDVTVADLNGDGSYEYILRWEPTNTWGGGHPNRHTGPVLIDAYTLDGEHLWRINLGTNINASAHITQMNAYDLDGDGRAEIALKTADGTIDGRGNVIGEGDRDYRGANGVVLRGPEYLTLFDGLTGAKLDTQSFIPQRHPDTHSPTRDQIWDVWGDNYGGRMDRFNSCIAYLDGVHPFLVTARGYYHGKKRGGRTCIAAWQWKNHQLENVWVFDTLGHPELAGYIGQGNHQVSVADLDGDGRDEIVFGGCAIDDDGSGLYTTELGHGDALHVTDMDPQKPGLEVFDIHEGTAHDAGIEFRASDGSAIWKKHPHRDVGRGVAFDIDPEHNGFEFWSTASNKLFNVRGETISDKKPRWTNMGIWWDGDLLRELVNGTIIDKWDWQQRTNQRLLTAYRDPYFASQNNGTKANPCLIADVLGDWREELILRSNDNTRLMIFVSTIPTQYRLRTLMHDPHYRVSVDWQNVGYNQPAHTGFYLGEGMSLPQSPFAIRYAAPATR
ncbi:rhamnogalacturonan lyase [Rhodopirellula sallentina]|uniref:Polysaccharide lyase family protein 11 n=1 Tax=Rhodopirellula sallentina SM41 TaxID=1263870 RepID=M5UMK5_9BACT|nr:rhamnogalacturonan lyase [Rhodopirellula sallentina]EMI57218.1 polysaccharide lyase family protein 11 [Rhodopirellula sallentina SM41]